MIDCFLVLYTFFGLRFFEILCCVCIACCDCIVFYFLVIKKPTELRKKKSKQKLKERKIVNWTELKQSYGMEKRDGKKKNNSLWSSLISKPLITQNFFFFPPSPSLLSASSSNDMSRSQAARDRSRAVFKVEKPHFFKIILENTLDEKRLVSVQIYIILLFWLFISGLSVIFLVLSVAFSCWCLSLPANPSLFFEDCLFLSWFGFGFYFFNLSYQNSCRFFRLPLLVFSTTSWFVHERKNIAHLWSFCFAAYS